MKRPKKEPTLLERFKLATAVPVNDRPKYLCLYSIDGVDRCIRTSIIPGSILTPFYYPSLMDSIFYIELTEDIMQAVKDLLPFAYTEPVFLLYARLINCVQAGIVDMFFEDGKLMVTTSKPISAMSHDEADTKAEKLLSEVSDFEWKLKTENDNGTITYVVGLHVGYTDTYRETFETWYRHVHEVKRERSYTLDLTKIATNQLQYITVNNGTGGCRIPLVSGQSIPSKSFIGKVKAKQPKITMYLKLIGAKYFVPFTTYKDEFNNTIECVQPGMLKAWHNNFKGGSDGHQ